MCLIYCVSIYYGNVSRETEVNGNFTGECFAGIFRDGGEKQGTVSFCHIWLKIKTFSSNLFLIKGVLLCSHS